MDNIGNWLQANLGIEPLTQHKLFLSTLLVVTLWLIHRLLLLNVQRIKVHERRYQWQKTI